MLQGDCYNLPFRITRHGRIMTNEDVSEVEICIGRLNKKYSNNAVFFSEGLWYFPFSQEETFAFRSTEQPIQIRIMFPSGEVKGFDLGNIDVKGSLSKDVLVINHD